MSGKMKRPFITYSVVFSLICIIVIALSQAGCESVSKTHVYGAPCTTSDGDTGIYATNGSCYTCSGDSTEYTYPINNNCSSGIGGVYCCKRYVYGAPCTDSQGKTGIYSLSGACATCDSGSTATTSCSGPTCSNNVDGVYCVPSGSGSGCIATGCPSNSPWLCDNGRCYADPDDYNPNNHNCRKCP